MARSTQSPQDRNGGPAAAVAGEERPVHDPVPFTEPDPGLSAASLDDFLVWASQVPHTQVDLVRDAIAAADADVVGALTSELGRLPIEDTGRFAVLLSTVGQLQSGECLEPLEALIWSDAVLTSTAGDPPDPQPGPGASNLMEPDLAIRARAAEMLSALGGQRADDAVLHVITGHWATAVRIAAIDAHLFNHGDDPALVADLREIVRPGDRPYVGLPRWTRDTRPEDFDAAVLDFYDRYPDERPPVPEGPAGGRDHVPVEPRPADLR